jgi:hypothetical protein
LALEESECAGRKAEHRFWWAKCKKSRKRAAAVEEDGEEDVGYTEWLEAQDENDDDDWWEDNEDEREEAGLSYMSPIELFRTWSVKYGYKYK